MREVLTSELVPGMVLGDDILNFTGQLVFSKDFVLTDKAITRLAYYSIPSVIIQDDDTELKYEEIKPIEIAPPPAFEESVHSQKVKASPNFQKFKKEFEENLESFKGSINDIVTLNKPIDPDALFAQTVNMTSFSDSSISTMDMIQNMREYDDLTFAHSMNVALICNVFAGWLHWDAEETKLVTLCGLLHDIGKLKIPDSIIKSPNKLTDNQYKIVKTHTIKGYEILKEHSYLDPHIAYSALMHHERYDGTGYPLGIAGEKIDKYARAVGIADVYDAMTSARVYRGPWCPYRVVELYENEGFQKYDPEFIITFLENVVNTYLHNDVLLSNGEKGTIVFNNKAFLSKPIVQTDFQLYDLSKETSLHIEKIL
ncbi:MAG: HD-GYP domain-containing protein [Lachnospiraceae bacterium]|nr:HD-GYP domain-containing protein [Lachnospiraceae bacterium]